MTSHDIQVASLDAHVPNFMTCKKLFFTIHTTTHWSLVSVDMSNRFTTRIVASDSALDDGRDAEHATLLVQMWCKKQWDIFYPGIQPPAYLVCVDKTAPQKTNGFDCGIFMLANLMAGIEGLQHCGYIDTPRVRAWILEELYIEGLKSNMIDEHGPALLTQERLNSSIFHVHAEPESLQY